MKKMKATTQSEEQEQKPLIIRSKEGEKMIPEYVYEHANELEMSLKTVYSTTSTNTCDEKIAELRRIYPEQSWGRFQAVKAIYALVDWDPFIFVLPELTRRFRGKRKRVSGGTLRTRRTFSHIGKIDGDLISRIFNEVGLSYQDPKPYIGIDAIPDSMEYGTCTPFISKPEMDRLNDLLPVPVKGIFIYDDFRLDDLVVDISLGGKGEESHKVSMHLPYHGIYDILRAEFGDRVHKLRMWDKYYLVS